MWTLWGQRRTGEPRSLRVLDEPQLGPVARLRWGLCWSSPQSLASGEDSPLAAPTSCFTGTSRVLGRAHAAEFLVF